MPLINKVTPAEIPLNNQVWDRSVSDMFKKCIWFKSIDQIQKIFRERSNDPSWRLFVERGAQRSIYTPLSRSKRDAVGQDMQRET